MIRTFTYLPSSN